MSGIFNPPQVSEPTQLNEQHIYTHYKLDGSFDKEARGFVGGQCVAATQPYLRRQGLTRVIPTGDMCAEVVAQEQEHFDA